MKGEASALEIGKEILKLRLGRTGLAVTQIRKQMGHGDIGRQDLCFKIERVVKKREEQENLMKNW